MRVELLDDVGDICRMHIVQTLMAHGELDLRHIALEKFHVVPRDETLFERMSKRLCNGADAFLERRSDAPEQAAHACFGSEQAQALGTVGKLEVVDAHDLHALRVDNLLVEQIAGQ